MKALYYDEFKGFEGIKAGDLPLPVPGPTDVLVRIKAFSLNHLDVWVMTGRYPQQVPLPHVFGSDAAGVVEAVGDAVQTVKPGDDVIIFPGLSCNHCEACLAGRDNECTSFSILGVIQNGVSAEFASIPATNIFPKPQGLSFEEAAALGITWTTAWNALVLRSGIRQKDTVLIHSAGSGAGSALIQVAKLFHAHVIATAGDDWKMGKAKELGADHVINYKKEDVSSAVKGITRGMLADIAIDHVGADTFNTSLSCIRRGGSLVTFGATSGNEVGLSLRHVFGKNIRIHGVYVGPKAAMLQYLKLMPDRARPVIDSVFEFRNAQKAYELLLSRQFFGKIVVRV